MNWKNYMKTGQDKETRFTIYILKTKLMIIKDV